MAKKIVVKLWKDGVGRSLVATSQVITLDGLGSGPVIAGDFADNTLQGTVNTSAQRGGFYKELKSPVWALNPLKTQVTAGNNIVLNWSTRPADITPAINWYAVNTGQQIIYTGSGLVSNKSTTPLLISGEGGTFNVATSPVDVNREVEITIWNGEFGISNLLARSGPIRIIAKELQASFPQAAYPFRTAIPLNISGYPNELVTYEGFGSAYTKGIKGNITLDSAGNFYVPDIRGGLDAPPGPYSYTFDGNITAKSVTTTVVVTTEGFYALQFTTQVPEIITIGDSLVLGVSGAPYERITYTGPTVGTFDLNAGGAASTPNLVGGQTLIANKQYTWRFNGNISINPLSLVVNTIAGKELNATGSSPIAQATAYSVTVTGKANDNITYTDVKANIPVLYFDYYPEAEAIWVTAGSPTDTASWISNYHTTTGSGLGFLSPTALAAEAGKNYTGSFTLGDIGGDNGSNTFQVVGSSGLLGRRTPYKFRFYSAQLNQTKEVSVTVNRIFTMRVVGPASVEAGKPIPITVFSVAGDNTVKLTGPNLPVGGYTLDAFNSSGQYSFNLQTPILTSALAAGSYTFNFDSARTDVINAGNAANTPYAITVTQVTPIQAVHTALSGFGPDEVPPNTTYQLTLRSSVGDVITIQKNFPASWAATNAYFDIYPDVKALYDRQASYPRPDEVVYATTHYESIGRIENRVSPEAAITYRNNLDPINPLTFGPLVKPNGSVDYGEVIANIGSYRYALASPIILKITGKGGEISKTFRVKLSADLTVNLPASAPIDDVTISIRGAARDEITCIKIQSATAGGDGIPRPIVPRQERIFLLGPDGIFVGDFLTGTENASGTLSDLDQGAVNTYYFFSKNTGATTQAAIRGASLVVQSGVAMLYSTSASNRGSFSAPELMVELPNQAVWLMYALVGGGGGAGGTETVVTGTSNAYAGGAGSQGMGIRGVVRLPVGSKKIFGVAGGGGRPGGQTGTLSSGGLGGAGAGFQVNGLRDGRGGNGASSSAQFITGGGGGGGGMSMISLQVDSVFKGGVAAGGGGGGAGQGNNSNNNGGNGIGILGAGPSIYDWGVTGYNQDVYNNLTGRNGNNATGNYGGGGGGGGGAGAGGITPGRTSSTGIPYGGAAGHNLIYRDPATIITEHDHETISINDTSGYITKLEPQNYWGLGGINGGAGSPGAIKLYWTTATTKPTDWGLLPSWPTQVNTNGSVVPLTWNVPTVSLTASVLKVSSWAFTNQGRIRAYNDTITIAPNTLAVTLDNGAEPPSPLLQDYYVRITLVSDGRVITGTGATIIPWVWGTVIGTTASAPGPSTPGDVRTYKFSEFSQIAITGYRRSSLGNQYYVGAQHKVEILSPNQLTVLSTGYIYWSQQVL